MIRSFAIYGFLALFLALPFSTRAFPPLPSHTVYGLVRDEFGNPLTAAGSELILETLAGATLTTPVVAGLDAGINYRIEVPVDAGLSADLYKPTAMHPTAPFRLKVKMGSKIFVPIEMKANYASLGQPAKSTRIDLTLGEDSDGDGLPDAWEKSVIAASGQNLTLEGLKPNSHLNGNSLSALEAYLAGTYAWDPADGFRLDIVAVVDELPILEFVALRGRSYTIQSSDDLTQWVPVQFRPTTPLNGTFKGFYQTTQLTQLRVQVQNPVGQPMPKFFKLLVN